jgi:hypothetical protein
MRLVSAARSLPAKIGYADLIDSLQCSLRMLYGKHLSNAFPLITSGEVWCLQASSTSAETATALPPRRVYKVKAANKEDVYTVLPWQFCTCESFQSIMRRGEEACVCPSAHVNRSRTATEPHLRKRLGCTIPQTLHGLSSGVHIRPPSLPGLASVRCSQCFVHPKGHKCDCRCKHLHRAQYWVATHRRCPCSASIRSLPRSGRRTAAAKR